MKNKKAQLIPEKLVKIILILTVLLIVFSVARVYMLYQTGMSDSGALSHFYLENMYFKNPEIFWSPADNDNKTITISKAGRTIAVGRDTDVEAMNCPGADTSKVGQGMIVDPLYGGFEVGQRRFFNGKDVKESELALGTAKKLSDYMAEVELTRDSDKAVSAEQRLAVVEKENPGIVIGLKMADNDAYENIIRAYVSSELSENNKQLSKLLACQILNAFIAGSKESITGISIMEVKPSEEQKIISQDRVAVIIEISNFNNDKAIEFSETDAPAKAIERGVNNFFKNKK